MQGLTKLVHVILGNTKEEEEEKKNPTEISEYAYNRMIKFQNDTEIVIEALQKEIKRLKDDVIHWKKCANVYEDEADELNVKLVESSRVEQALDDDNWELHATINRLMKQNDDLRAEIQRLTKPKKTIKPIKPGSE